VVTRDPLNTKTAYVISKVKTKYGVNVNLHCIIRGVGEMKVGQGIFTLEQVVGKGSALGFLRTGCQRFRS
jgi:hypothetical protein